MTEEQLREAQALAAKLIEPIQGQDNAAWLASVRVAIGLRRRLVGKAVDGEREADLDEAIAAARSTLR